MKTIIKELIITLLICLAIILLLGILLYQYNPSSKIIPEKVAYSTPESVKEELNKAEGVDESQVVMTYEINSADLNNYRRINNYVPGKSNPFSSFKKEVEPAQNTTSGTTSANSVNNSNSTSQTNNENQNQNNENNSNMTTDNTISEGTYLPDKGTK